MGNPLELNKSFDLQAAKDQREMELAFENFDDQPELTNQKSFTPNIEKPKTRLSRKTMGNISQLNNSFDIQAAKEQREVELAFENFDSQPRLTNQKSFIPNVEKPKTRLSRKTMGNPLELNKSFDLQAAKEQREMELAFENFYDQPTLSIQKSLTPNAEKPKIRHSRKTMGNTLQLNESFDLQAAKEQREMELAFQNFDDQANLINQKSFTPNVEKPKTRFSRKTMGNPLELNKSFDLQAAKEQREMELAFENFYDQPRLTNQKSFTPNVEKPITRLSRKTMGNTLQLNDSFDLQAAKEQREMELAFENFDDQAKLINQKSLTPNAEKPKIKHSRKTMGNTLQLNESFDMQAAKEQREVELAFENFYDQPTLPIQKSLTPNAEKPKIRHSRKTMGNTLQLNESFDLQAAKEQREMELVFENFNDQPRLTNRKSFTPNVEKPKTRFFRKSMGNIAELSDSFDFQSPKKQKTVESHGETILCANVNESFTLRVSEDPEPENQTDVEIKRTSVDSKAISSKNENTVNLYTKNQNEKVQVISDQLFGSLSSTKTDTDIKCNYLIEKSQSIDENNAVIKTISVKNVTEKQNKKVTRQKSKAQNNMSDDILKSNDTARNQLIEKKETRKVAKSRKNTISRNHVAEDPKCEEKLFDEKGKRFKQSETDKSEEISKQPSEGIDKISNETVSTNNSNYDQKHAGKKNKTIQKVDRNQEFEKRNSHEILISSDAEENLVILTDDQISDENPSIMKSLPKRLCTVKRKLGDITESTKHDKKNENTDSQVESRKQKVLDSIKTTRQRHHKVNGNLTEEVISDEKSYSTMSTLEVIDLTNNVEYIKDLKENKCEPLKITSRVQREVQENSISTIIDSEADSSVLIVDSTNSVHENIQMNKETKEIKTLEPIKTTKSRRLAKENTVKKTTTKDDEEDSSVVNFEHVNSTNDKITTIKELTEIKASKPLRATKKETKENKTSELFKTTRSGRRIMNNMQKDAIQDNKNNSLPTTNLELDSTNDNIIVDTEGEIKAPDSLKATRKGRTRIIKEKKINVVKPDETDSSLTNLNTTDEYTTKPKTKTEPLKTTRRGRRRLPKENEASTVKNIETDSSPIDVDTLDSTNEIFIDKEAKTSEIKKATRKRQRIIKGNQMQTAKHDETDSSPNNFNTSDSLNENVPQKETKESETSESLKIIRRGRPLKKDNEKDEIKNDKTDSPMTNLYQVDSKNESITKKDTKETKTSESSKPTRRGRRLMKDIQKGTAQDNENDSLSTNLHMPNSTIENIVEKDKEIKPSESLKTTRKGRARIVKENQINALKHDETDSSLDTKLENIAKPETKTFEATKTTRSNRRLIKEKQIVTNEGNENDSLPINSHMINSTNENIIETEKNIKPSESLKTTRRGRRLIKENQKDAIKNNESDSLVTNLTTMSSTNENIVEKEIEEVPTETSDTAIQESESLKINRRGGLRTRKQNSTKATSHEEMDSPLTSLNPKNNLKQEVKENIVSESLKTNRRGRHTKKQSDTDTSNIEDLMTPTINSENEESTYKRGRRKLVNKNNKLTPPNSGSANDEDVTKKTLKESQIHETPSPKSTRSRHYANKKLEIENITPSLNEKTEFKTPNSLAPKTRVGRRLRSNSTSTPIIQNVSVDSKHEHYESDAEQKISLELIHSSNDGPRRGLRSNSRAQYRNL